MPPENEQQQQRKPEERFQSKKQEQQAPRKAVQVRAKVAHTQPGSLTYREKGDEFSHIGEPYEHVELVKRPQPADEADDLDGE